MRGSLKSLIAGILIATNQVMPMGESVLLKNKSRSVFPMANPFKRSRDYRNTEKQPLSDKQFAKRLKRSRDYFRCVAGQYQGHARSIHK